MSDNVSDTGPLKPEQTPASKRARMILFVVIGGFVLMNLCMAYFLMFHR